MKEPRIMQRSAYALPSVFTAGTIFCGYYAAMKTLQAIALPPERLADAAANFDLAAIAIGVAVFTDGMDGRIARITNAVSEFGRELDSLADVVTFGLAPALLAFAWGTRLIDPAGAGAFANDLVGLAYLVSFLFLVCGAARLARFNVQRNPVPKNPGRLGRKYFVGLPIPAAAAVVAAVVHAAGGHPIRGWLPWGLAWLALLGLLSFLMVCTWRYNSFKEINPFQQRLTWVLVAMMIVLIWSYSQPVLLGMASVYAASGFVVRIGGLFRRRVRPMEAADERR